MSVRPDAQAPDRVLLFTLAMTGYETVFADCLASQREYCRRHGYEYLVITESPRPLRATESSWLKIPLLRSALASGRYSLVAFVDADCEIRPHAPDLRTLAGAVLMAPGQSGRINAGVIIARPEVTALGFFDLLIARADAAVPDEDQAPYENGHVIHFGKDHPAVRLLAHRQWNNNSVLDPQSFIQHYAQGALRSHYLKRGTGSLLMWLRLFLRRVEGWARKRAPLADVTISRSLAELTPFYVARYSSFRSERVRP